MIIAVAVKFGIAGSAAAITGSAISAIAVALALIVAWAACDTAIAAYGSFLTAEHLGASGVLATVAAGVTMGNLGVLVEKESPTALSTTPVSIPGYTATGDVVSFTINGLLAASDFGHMPADSYTQAVTLQVNY